MAKIVTLIATISGALSVIFGAFGAHKFKLQLTANGYLDTFQTASFYHLTHSIVLLAIGIMLYRTPSNLLNFAAYSNILGLVLFSGSLYALALTNTPKLGIITPFGGLFLILSWLLIAVFAYKHLG
jgi:uncharacterized membrane protein YgdD (TMEM256/DUF423 family)